MAIASKREFNVGWDATTQHLAAQFALREDTLKRIVQLGATLGVTLYRADPEFPKTVSDPKVLAHDP